MNFLDLPYLCGASSICADGSRAAKVLGRLSSVFDLGTLSSEPRFPVIATLRDSFEGVPLFTEQGVLDFHFTAPNSAVVSIHEDVGIDGNVFIHGVCGRLLLTAIQALYPAARIALHGALLEEDGAGIVLLGGSGVGKSTALRRHNKHGGTGIADDWLLINDTPQGFVAQVLPTWSRVSHSFNCRFPIAHAVPLKGIGVLERAEGTPPRKASIDELEFYAQIFNASEMLTSLILAHLSREANVAARLSHIRIIDKLMDSCTPFKYFAALDDNPSEILFGGNRE